MLAEAYLTLFFSNLEINIIHRETNVDIYISGDVVISKKGITSINLSRVIDDKDASSLEEKES